MKNSKLIYCLTALACVCFISCQNPIMKKWWQESEPESELGSEPEYIPITKMVPQVTHDIIYDTIYEQVIQYVPQYIYETITEYVPVYEEVIKEVPVYIYEKDDPEFETIVKEYIRDHFDEVIKIINESPDKDEIIEKIIQSIPPDEITKYLTIEQIRYILEQQPPQVILQTLKIIDIEYIIFAGNAESYNGSPGTGGSTPLTAQEKASNDTSVAAIAQALKDHPDYLIMLHGHANPTAFTDAETGDLKAISENRAKAVEAKLRDQYKALNGGVGIDDSRVSVSGYGGEKVLFGNNSVYTPLNRRVEMILVWVGVQ